MDNLENSTIFQENFRNFLYLTQTQATNFSMGQGKEMSVEYLNLKKTSHRVLKADI